MGQDIQQILDAKTNPWGISIFSVEFTDIIIPKELEDAMSRKAQAERERQARIILGTAEAEVASKFEEAARAYKGNPEALQLRAMNMVYEGMKYNKKLPYAAALIRPGKHESGHRHGRGGFFRKTTSPVSKERQNDNGETGSKELSER